MEFLGKRTAALPIGLELCRSSFLLLTLADPESKGVHCIGVIQIPFPFLHGDMASD